MEINSGPKNFSKKRVILFLETQDNPFYYQYIYAISKDINESDGILQVVTLPESFGFRKFRNIPRFLRRKIALIALEKDLTTTFPRVSFTHKSSNPNLEIKKQVKSTLRLLSLAHQLCDVLPEYKYLGPSLHSLCTSAFSMSSDPLAKISKYKKLLERACAMYISHFHIAIKTIREFSPDLVIFLNGRTPEQAAFKEVAERMNLSWLALEHGAKPGKTYFLEDFQTQDRLKTQELIKSFSLKLTQEELDQVLLEIDKWVQRQTSDRTQNPTLSLRNLSAKNSTVGQSIFPIFTSSIDEEMSCPNWSDDNVRSLTTRTVMASQAAMRKGLLPIVVVHPNTLNKKWHDLSLIYSELTRYDIHVSLPWHQISSYEYLDKSNSIATWRSTMGLEAILRNKCVVILSDTVYDKLVSFNSMDEIDFFVAESDGGQYVNAKFAKLAINYYLNFGYDLIAKLAPEDIIRIRKYEKILPLGGLIPSVRNKFRKFVRPLKVYGATPREIFDFLSFFMPRLAVERVMKFLIRHYRY